MLFDNIVSVICIYFEKFNDLFQERARVNGKPESYHIQH